MCMLQIHAQCPDKCFEVSPDETEHAELMVEDMISRILLALFGFGSVKVDSGMLSPSASDSEHDPALS
jgi:hypothetical protein